MTPPKEMPDGQPVPWVAVLRSLAEASLMQTRREALGPIEPGPVAASPCLVIAPECPPERPRRVMYVHPSRRCLPEDPGASRYVAAVLA